MSFKNSHSFHLRASVEFPHIPSTTLTFDDDWQVPPISPGSPALVFPFTLKSHKMYI